MKRIVGIFIYVSVAFLFGCSGVGVNLLQVVDDTIYSTNSPRLKIQISNDFKHYDGSNKIDNFSTSSGHNLNANSESHIFIEEKNSKYMHSMIEVLAENLHRGFFTGEFFIGVKPVIWRRQILLAGHTFEECIYIASFDERKKIVEEMGYVPFKDVIIRGLATSSNEQKALLFYYSEDINQLIPNPSYRSATKWKDYNFYDEIQKKIVKDFVERSDKAFVFKEMLKSESVPVAPTQSGSINSTQISKQTQVATQSSLGIVHVKSSVELLDAPDGNRMRLIVGRNEPLTAIEETSFWVKVRDSAGNNGWIDKSVIAR